jgi:hypothetical protein
LFEVHAADRKKEVVQMSKAQALEVLLRKNRHLLKPRGKGVKLTGKQFISLFRPGVYILTRGAEYLYIGKCESQVIKRAVVTNPRALDRATALQTIWCRNARAARQLEAVLIKELGTTYNIRGRS